GNVTTFNNPPAFESDGGGGLHASAPITVIDSHFENNSSAGRGGGLFLTGGVTTTALISNTNILGNFAAGDGGGLRSFTNLTVVDSTIANNVSLEDGGGIDDDYGRILVRNSLLQNNSTAEDGGGIEVNGVLTVEGSTIISNTAGFTGGGIWVEKTTTIRNSTIISNAATLAGGGFTNSRGVATIESSIIAQNSTPNAGGGLLNSEAGRLTLRNSQVRDNRAVDGGGIANLNGALLIEGSEISSNQANNGGAIFNTASTSMLSMINSTISANAGLSTAGGIRNSSYAGIKGAYIFAQGGTVNLQHVTLSNNSSGNLLDNNIGNYAGAVNVKNSVLDATNGLNCFNAGTFTAQGGNLYSDTSCGAANSADLVGVDPQLGPLADNGGPLLPDGHATRTHTLLLASPARDFVNCELTTDQRGAPRPSPFTTLCDSGAVELQNVRVDLGVEKTVTPATAQPGQPVTYTITVRNLGDIANRVVLTDAVLAEIIVSSVKSSGINFVQTGTAPYSWRVDQVGQAAVGSILIAGIVDPQISTGATVLNTATVLASGDYVPANNSAVAPLTIAPPHIHFDRDAYSVNEDAGAVVLGVALDVVNPYHDVTIHYIINGGTATAADYTGSSGSVTIAAGTRTATITVPITVDAVVELDEKFTVALNGPQGAVLDAPTTATVTIVNDDAAALSINDVTQLEGDSGFTDFIFTVTLDRAVDTGLTLMAATSNGTASSGGDYSAVDVLLGFAGTAGETQTVYVPVSGDHIGELDETFNVTLRALASSGRAVSLVDAVGVGTILNDDGPGIIVQPTTLTVSEPNTTADFVLTLTSQPTANVVVSLSASDQSECTVPPSAILNTGNWRTGVPVTVQAVDDDDVDGDQLCTIQLMAASGDPTYNGILIESVAVIVRDDDTPPDNQPPVIADQRFTIDENSPLGTTVGVVAASDPDVGQTLVYTITAISAQPTAAQGANAAADTLAASSFVIGATTGQLLLTENSPNYEEINAYTLTIQVADSGTPALSQTATVSVIIRDVNEPPVVVNPVPSQQVLVNDAAGFGMASNTFADPDLNDVLSYSVTLVDGSPLPAWLAFDPTTGLFGGTPSTAETLAIRITATDLGGLQASTDFTLTVTGIPTSLDESDEPVFKAQIFLPIMER
ncbi:MAG: cadherin domain-containing protein, partial [Caldilineaceae bacterium]|nr:cadherin domain-containing protein [Caldilineaceae bacterium]